MWTSQSQRLNVNGRMTNNGRSTTYLHITNCKSLVIGREMQKEMKIQENLSYINVIKLASSLLYGNINLVLFLFLCSLPLFCFLIFFELSLQTTISLASQYLHQRSSVWYYYAVHQKSAENLIPWLIKIFLLYLFPYSLIDLFTTMTVVSAFSIVYTSEEEVPLRFRQLVWRTLEICQNRFRDCLTTSLYVLLLSTSVFFGFFFAATNYFYIIDLFGTFGSSYYYTNSEGFGDYYYGSSSISNDPTGMLIKAVMALFHGAIFIVLMANFSKWSAGWNMGLIISVLEEEGEDGQRISGNDALTLSAYYGRGHEKRGLRVMLVFLVFALVMRMPCFCFKCSESSTGNGVLYTSLYVGLICVGNAIKWVACVVCYYDCRTRVLEKKGDMEIGSKAKASAT